MDEWNRRGSAPDLLTEEEDERVASEIEPCSASEEEEPEEEEEPKSKPPLSSSSSSLPASSGSLSRRGSSPRDARMRVRTFEMNENMSPSQRETSIGRDGVQVGAG